MPMTSVVEALNEMDGELSKGKEDYKNLLEEFAVLEKELTLSTDQNDLLLDEFIRVKHLTDNTEIQGLCERAHVRMRQNVSVIDRNHKLTREVSELRNKVKALASLVYESCINELDNEVKINPDVLGDKIFNIVGVTARQLRKEQDHEKTKS
jgi:hypothetical protein